MRRSAKIALTAVAIYVSVSVAVAVLMVRVDAASHAAAPARQNSDRSYVRTLWR